MIFYFGEHEEELNGGNTDFIPSEQWPRICDLAAFASRRKGYTAIINADIVVTEDLRKVVDVMSRCSIAGATSRRRDLITKEMKLDDKGRDIFILSQRWWRIVSDKIPKSCRIGHNEWDSWMIGFMRYEAKTRFADFSGVPCIYHPEHEERMQPHVGEVDITGKYKGYWNGVMDPAIVL